MQNKHTNAGEAHRPALSCPKRGDHGAKQVCKNMRTKSKARLNLKHPVVKTTKPHKMSHVMRKPVLAICEQQKCRSACASASFVVRYLDSIIPIFAGSKISRLAGFCSAATGLSLTWSETPKTGCLVTWLK